jgi:hypothetical protein
MRSSENQGQPRVHERRPALDPPAYDVVTFCAAHHIAKSYFYELLRTGRGPRIMKVGRRTIISGEAAAEWRSLMEKGN